MGKSGEGFKQRDYRWNERLFVLQTREEPRSSHRVKKKDHFG